LRGDREAWSSFPSLIWDVMELVWARDNLSSHGYLPISNIASAKILGPLRLREIMTWSLSPVPEDLCRLQRHRRAVKGGDDPWGVVCRGAVGRDASTVQASLWLF
jgi:hypothetical protein